MKIFLKFAALLLIVVMVLSFGACESTADKMEALAGTYTLVSPDDGTEAKYLLEYIEADEAEIALADLNSMSFVQSVYFSADGSYYFAYDGEATKEYVKAFYEGYFADLYENRTSLNDVYDFSFDDLSEEEFYELYACDIYARESYADLIDYLTENAYLYDTLSEPWESGTYTIRSGHIECTVTGESKAETLGYELDGNTLTLIYSDGKEVYTKAN